MITIGLDLSLAQTGVAVPGRTFVIRPDGLTGDARLPYFAKRVAAVVREVEADLAVLEGYALGVSGAGVRSNAELGGVVKMVLLELGVVYVIVPPASLKLFATGTGGPAATKDAMFAAAQRDGLLFAGRTWDEADAYWLLQVGDAICGRRKLTDYQRRALAKVIVPAGIRRRATAVSA